MHADIKGKRKRNEYPR